MIPLLDYKAKLSVEREADAMIFIRMGFIPSELAVLFYNERGKRTSQIVPIMVTEETR